MPADREQSPSAPLHLILEERLAGFRSFFNEFYPAQRKQLIAQSLKSEHSFEILHSFTSLLDLLHQLAFETALDEFDLLLRSRVLQVSNDLDFRRTQFPSKTEKLAHLKNQIDQLSREHQEQDKTGDQDRDRQDEIDYYRGYSQDLERELEDYRQEIDHLEKVLPVISAYRPDRADALSRLVMFARGGYGRAEMSFASDIDTGYCLDTAGLDPGLIPVFREIIIRAESLLSESGLRTSHQYFELDEDLSRFTANETLHTIPSVLEGRAICGNSELLDSLIIRFRKILPFERFVRRKCDEYEHQERPGLSSMDLKEDFGGLRSIQTPLWLLGVTGEARSFHSSDLLRLGMDRGLLSHWECSRLLFALELLYDLRNFGAVAEESFYDQEARDAGIAIHSFGANQIDDSLARLYLFRKNKLNTLDELDRRRLRCIHEVQQISARLMRKVLNRTLNHRLQEHLLKVHLGEKRIISIIPIQQEIPVGNEGWPDSPQNAPSSASVDVSLIFSGAEPLLELMGYIAETDFDLCDELKDRLAAVVMSITPPTQENVLERQSTLFSLIIAAPYAHRALGTMFQINDPLQPQVASLIGRFIPEYDQVLFLHRKINGHSYLLHEHLLKSVSYGQEGLEWLRSNYPELYHQLSGLDVLALKWSLFLNGLEDPEGISTKSSDTAEKASRTLKNLGYRDEELDTRVRLLIEHNRSLVSLSRTATYIDQALARYFELAERNTISVVLMYLMNRAVLKAEGVESEADLVNLQRMFYEASQILAEMRGIPSGERSLEVINIYFDHKKLELIAETKLHLILQKVLSQGVRSAVQAALNQSLPQEALRFSNVLGSMEDLQGQIILGEYPALEREALEDRLLNGLRNNLSPAAIQAVLGEDQERVSWFFSSYPNRYLLAELPQNLATKLQVFSTFKNARVIVDMVINSHLGNHGLLIFTRGLSRSHSRVAYSISRFRLNIVSGKINRVDLSDDEHGYCYFFQISHPHDGEMPAPREMERVIISETPPEVPRPHLSHLVHSHGVRLEFGGNDRKGYKISHEEGRYVRLSEGFPHLKVIVRDEPFLYFKVCRVFDLYGVEIQQALITTTGNQVVDYFYLLQEDYDRLGGSDFEESFIRLVNSDMQSYAG